MSKEKLTLESVVEVIRDNTLTSDGVELLTNLLKQIRDEIICVEDEPISEDSYFGKEDIFVSITKIVKVFNKYLNEK